MKFITRKHQITKSNKFGDVFCVLVPLWLMNEIFASMYRKDTLSNGIRVVSETLPKSRSVSIGVWVKVGSRHEPQEIGGISHFIEHLFFKGTEKRTAKDIAIEMDSIGGEMNAFTSQETTTYYAKVVDEHLPVAIEILSDILLGSKFDPRGDGKGAQGHSRGDQGRGGHARRLHP